jgi:hypothetical protein
MRFAAQKTLAFYFKAAEKIAVHPYPLALPISFTPMTHLTFR